MFVAETKDIGLDLVTEYSVFLIPRVRWLTVLNSGAICFDSDTPQSLSQFYDDPAAGSEDFAFDMLAWLHTSAGTGEIVENRVVDIPAEHLATSCVMGFQIERPKVVETGLSFNHAFRSNNVTFEVKGPELQVDFYLAGYLREYPQQEYRTEFAVQGIAGDEKTVRVMRRKLFD